MQNKEKNMFYLGNKNLPRPDLEMEWTPQMVYDLKKCKLNIQYFAENFFYIVNLDRGREKVELYKCQKRVLKSLRENRFVCMLASRQSGKTSLLTIYCLWVACFQEDQNILIVANKEQTAINIFKRVRLAYEMLPNYLKPGVLEYGKTSMHLANGSSIGISTTTSDAGRGSSCNCLVLDELAFIDTHLVQDFWRSVYPIISSSKKAKIFIASTPNGTDNLFHQLYVNAEKGENGWKSERVDWWEIPGRDDKWKDNTIKTLGSVESFNQEFANVFIQTGESAINDSLYDILKTRCIEPKYILDDNAYMLWEEPNPNNLYVVGVDVSEGIGENASVVQILNVTDLTNITQAGTYYNAKISPYNFTTKLYEILQHWGCPPVAIERNNCGAQVVDNIINQHGYSNIITFAPKNNDTANYDTRRGVVAHTNTKYKGIMNMRYWINHLQAVKIFDIHTLNEIKTFIRHPNGSWAAKRDGACLDDRVMSLVWSLIVLESDITERHFQVLKIDDNKRPLILGKMDYGVRRFVNPLSMYSNEKIFNKNINVAPVIIGDTKEVNNDISDLTSTGWTFLDQGDKE